MTRKTITRTIDQTTGELLAEKLAVSDNKDFFMFYRDHLQTITKLSEHPPALKVFLWIVSRMDKTNALMCSVKVMSEALAISEPTIYRALTHLKANKYIETVKSGVSNIYLVNALIVWQSKFSRFQHAEFTATVVVSDSEQTKQGELFHDKAFKKRIIATVSKKGKTQKEQRKEWEEQHKKEETTQ